MIIELCFIRDLLYSFFDTYLHFSVKNMSAGRQEAFDHFRRDNPLNEKLEEHKRILKQRYTEAKTLGEEINQCRNRISKNIVLHSSCFSKRSLSRSYERTI
jgi:hypothetical protein